jgi:hypothetical protein
MAVAAFIITRIHVGDYDTWRSMFDKDLPRAREKATVVRVFRRVDDPNHVFVVSSSGRSPTPTRPARGSSRRVSSSGSKTGTDRMSSKRSSADGV